MPAVIYFSLALPPNLLFHQLSVVAWVILISFPRNIFSAFGRWFHRFAICWDNNWPCIFKGSNGFRAIFLTSKAWQQVKRCGVHSQWSCVSRRRAQGLIYYSMRQQAREIPCSLYIQLSRNRVKLTEHHHGGVVNILTTFMIFSS